MPDKLDQALINRVQQARRAHDAQVRPSQISGVYWIDAHAPQAVPGPTARAGAWVARVPLAQVDAFWQRIKAETEAGKLGYKARIATASRDAQPVRLVHVMVADSADQALVARVHTALQALSLPLIWEYRP